MFDALLVVSFGGPEGPDDVVPFLRNVTRGRDIPDERLEVVAAQYRELGGVSPINGLNRALVASLAATVDVPVYWGNRNWSPFLADTVRQMAKDGVRRAVAFVTSPYSSYSTCRQYSQDIESARAASGAAAPEIVKIGPYFDRSGFVNPFADGLRAARIEAGPDAPILMTAHSIPLSMAETCAYEAQLRRAASLVAVEAGEADDAWRLVFQSRSGPPQQPWLGPEIEDTIDALPAGTETVIVVPIGFVSDHMEVVYDLDRKAARRAAARGIRLLRCPTPGNDPRFVTMIADLANDPVEVCTGGCCPVPSR